MALWKAGLKGSYILAEGYMAWIMPRLHLLQGYISTCPGPTLLVIPDDETERLDDFMGPQSFSWMRCLSIRVAGRESQLKWG